MPFLMRTAILRAKPSFYKTLPIRSANSNHARHPRAVSNTLTADDVGQFAPYLDVGAAEPIEIAPSVTGVTFTDSDFPPMPGRLSRAGTEFARTLDREDFLPLIQGSLE